MAKSRVTMGSNTKNCSLAGKPEMLDHWRQWEGAIDCGFTGKIWSAAELHDLTRGMVNRLIQVGLREGDIVALLLSNTAAFPVALLTLLETGCNPLLIWVATQEVEFNRILADFGIQWAVHDFIEGLSNLPKTGYREIEKIHIGKVGISILSTSELGRGPALDLPAAGVVLHPTSGTYGESKYCIRNQRVAVAEGRNYVDTIGFYRDIRFRVTTPLSHAFAYGFGLVSSILTDGILVLDHVFNPKKVLRREKEQPSDILAIVPPMAKPLIQLGNLDPSPRMAKTVFYAGAACDPIVAEEFQKTFSTVLFSIYGTTETGAISTSYSDSGKLTGVGRPLQNTDVMIQNFPQYSDLGDQVGEICVKSTALMQGYIRDYSNPAVIDYWPTGDIGFLDDAGNITIVGRVKDIINLGGMKVNPAEVENVLISHPLVADAAVYPGLRDDNTEYVQAAVRVESVDTGADELRSYCLHLLDAFKVPTLFNIVDEIPRSSSGKCLKIFCPGFPKRFIRQ